MTFDLVYLSYNVYDNVCTYVVEAGALERTYISKKMYTWSP